MTTIFHNREGEGSFWWRERVFMLDKIFMIRICEKNMKVEINFKDKPKESIACTPQEIQFIIDQLPKQS